MNDNTETKQEELNLRLLLDLSIALSTATELDEMLQRLLETILRIEGPDCGGIYLVDDSTGCLDLSVHSGLLPEFVTAASHFDADAPQTQLVLKGKLIHTCWSDLRPLYNGSAREQEKLKAISIIPIQFGGRTIAAMNISSHECDRFDADTIALMEAAAVQVGGFLTRIKTEEKLKETAATLESIFRVAPVGIGVVINRVIKWTNDKFSEITGYSSDEMKGRDARFLYPTDEHYEYVGREKYAQIKKKGTGTVETQMKRKDGAIVDILLSSTPLDISDLSKGITFTALDITDRKKAEEEIKRKNEELLSALQVKTEFLSMVSHELRSPLVPILGYSEMLHDGHLGELPREAVAPVAAIKERAEDLTTLIDDLLILTRLDHSKLVLKLEPVDVQHHIRETIADYKLMDQSIPISIDYCGDDSQVIADQIRFRQVLRNLIDNAIKYSEDSVEIQISTHADDGMVRICDEDNGIGIQPDYLPRIFDRFYQIENVDIRSHCGAGLGLSVTKELLELMNGSISVESDPGKGTKFTVMLPIA